MASMLDSFKTGKVPKSSDLMCKIEAFDADLGRTGTMSFSAALEKLLEGPIYHSGNMLISDDEYYMQHHIDWLKRIVPPERLYFFNVKDSWEPLCKILNIPVPNEPFHRINEKAAMKKLDNVMMGVRRV
ncbi:hypothetical protein EG329_000405 [Mollisiaceae sp. DMI_Dod_QoI]|nr:hypothetical protein EG329_000405 [Helotiales sp. DMI_Dod_QoI]